MSVYAIPGLFDVSTNGSNQKQGDAEDSSQFTFSDIFQTLRITAPNRGNGSPVGGSGDASAEGGVDSQTGPGNRNNWSASVTTDIRNNLLVSRLSSFGGSADLAVRFDELGMFGINRAISMDTLSSLQHTIQNTERSFSEPVGDQVKSIQKTSADDGRHIAAQKNTSSANHSFTATLRKEILKLLATASLSVKPDAGVMRAISSSDAADSVEMSEALEPFHFDRPKSGQLTRAGTGANISVWVNLNGSPESPRLLIRMPGELDMKEAELRREIARLFQEQGVSVSDITIQTTDHPQRTAAAREHR
ncbi:MAG: hypothetical protein AAGA08_16720 [Pseudomonadota bacterium]